MKGETVILAERLSKTFYISNEEADSSGNSFREELAGKVQKLVSFKRSPKVRTIKPVTAFEALKDVSFEVKKGSRVGIIGRNGAGKSTLLKILSNITGPTSGKVSVHGKVVSLLEVGTGFHQELTGRENIFLNGVVLGMKRAEIREKFDEIVAFAEIDKFLDTPVKKYSSGMYMRLAFAIASHVDSDILILDEMLAVGDAEFQRKCLLKMDEISKADGRTVLFVSHNIDSVTSFCDHGIYLKDGQVVAQGQIKDVVKEYMVSIHEHLEKFSPHIDRDIYFNRLSFKKTEISFGEVLELECELISKHRHERYVIGISVSDILDAKVAGNVLFIERPLNPGSNILRLKIPTTTIVPDNYSLNIAVALTRALSNIDVVLGHPEFTIVSDSTSDVNTEDVFNMWSRHWGSHILNNIVVN